jgi:hypothetical protein
MLPATRDRAPKAHSTRSAAALRESKELSSVVSPLRVAIPQATNRQTLMRNFAGAQRLGCLDI